ncbi:MAG: TIR domain-containing protein [Hyphomicrobium sp.]
MAETEKLKVFISYSRDDLKFADQLDAALDLTGFASMIDRQGISGAEEWRKRLGDLIRDADTVVFVLSPSSARSDVCAWEVGEAAKLSKRIVPVICRPLEDASPPSQLQQLNYIFFYDEPKSPGSGFGAGLAQLVATLNTDFTWVREHTRLLARAAEWDGSGRPENRLLFGSVIADAKAWAARRPKDAPEPTALHLDFIRASEQVETERNDAARLQVEERAKTISEREQAFARAATAQRIRNVVLVAMTGIAVVAGWQWRRAEQQKHVAETQTELATNRLKTVGLLSAASSVNMAVLYREHKPRSAELRPLINGLDDGSVLAMAQGAIDAALQEDQGQPTDPDIERRMMTEMPTLNFYAGVSGMLAGDEFFARGEFKRALENYRAAIQLCENGIEKRDVPVRYWIGQIHGRIAQASEKDGDAAAAKSAYEQGLAIMREPRDSNVGDKAAAEIDWFEARLAALVAPKPPLEPGAAETPAP